MWRVTVHRQSQLKSSNCSADSAVDSPSKLPAPSKLKKRYAVHNCNYINKNRRNNSKDWASQFYCELIVALLDTRSVVHKHYPRHSDSEGSIPMVKKKSKKMDILDHLAQLKRKQLHFDLK